MPLAGELRGMSAPVHRNAVVKLLGTPTLTEGSLNEPRKREENGVRFNEKWTYKGLRKDPSGAPCRVIYWLRYDFLATMVAGGPEGPWRLDTTLIEALRGISGRLPELDPSHNPPVTPSNQYRPASDARDEDDLGGYIQGEPQAAGRAIPATLKEKSL